MEEEGGSNKREGLRQKTITTILDETVFPFFVTSVGVVSKEDNGV